MRLTPAIRRLLVHPVSIPQVNWIDKYVKAEEDTAAELRLKCRSLHLFAERVATSETAMDLGLSK